MKTSDWKRAMLNEAEASGDEGWAAETRKEASSLRYWIRELGRIMLVAALGGVLRAAVVEPSPAWFGAWPPALALCALAFAALGLLARWYVGGAVSAFMVFVLLTLSLLQGDNLAQWPLQGWPGALLLASVLAGAYWLGQWQGGRWQPFGAWRTFDPADFAAIQGQGLKGER
ncbi:hypothetical protein ACFP81_02130 [Deinococcus lacus]|uniref:Uncharacterized protein n=1 Tax=Deinococcus lacus TaxID=392561 RepID=A0ABW1YDG1_9DEIO